MTEKVTHGELTIWPYATAADGSPSFSDEYLMGVYDIMEDQHLLRWVFFSGGVNNREEFRDFIKSREAPFFVLVDVKDNMKPYGHILLTECKAKCANIHFCFFRMNEKLRYAVYCANKAMEIMGYDCLIGVTPKTNLKINRFMETIPGWVRQGEIPISSWDATEQKTVDSVVYYYLGPEIKSDENI
jgi:hypothetical protein